MTSTDSNEPSADEFDAELASALDTNRSHENTVEAAGLVAAYYRTLVENDVPDESATELTCLWFAHSFGSDE